MDSEPAAQAVECLVHEYGKLVFHFIYGLTADWEESQDLTQDTFVQALRAIDAARESSGAHFHRKAPGPSEGPAVDGTARVGEQGNPFVSWWSGPERTGVLHRRLV